MKEKISYNVLSKYRGVLMGLAIISILFFHYTDDCRIYQHDFTGLIEIFNRYISSSSVDAFLFLSGFGLYYAFKKNNNLASFYKRRMTKILIPYILVAVPAWFWRDFIYNNAGVKTYIKDVLFVSFFNKNVTWFWYILMIVICYLIFPYVFEIVETAKDKITSQMRAIVIFLFFTLIAIMLQLYYDSFFGNVNIALLRFPAFFIGCFLGKASYNKSEISHSWIGIMILSFLLLQLRDCNRIIIVRYVLAFFNINLCILFAICAELLNRKGIKFGLGRKIIEWFGTYSLELYLTHVMIRGIMNLLGYNTCYIEYEAIMLGLSIVSSVILKKLTNLMIHKINRIEA